MLPLTAFAYLDETTPVQEREGIFLKRDDLFLAAGAPGGKARTCWALAQGAAGLVTASSRSSPQMNIVARIAAYLKIPARLHTPLGPYTPEMLEAESFGAQIIQHKAGYNSVIKARARDDAEAQKLKLIPFGMECQTAIEETSKQTANLPSNISRIVMPVGSGMSLAGVIQGTAIPILGIVVGADPAKRLQNWSPFWEQQTTLKLAGIDYHKPAPKTTLSNINLDPIYEAKCLPFLQPGDLFWIVGIRASSNG